MKKHHPGASAGIDNEFLSFNNRAACGEFGFIREETFCAPQEGIDENSGMVPSLVNGALRSVRGK